MNELQAGEQPHPLCQGLQLLPLSHCTTTTLGAPQRTVCPGGRLQADLQRAPAAPAPATVRLLRHHSQQRSNLRGQGEVVLGAVSCAASRRSRRRALCASPVWD